MLKVFKISILLFFFSFSSTNILLSDDLKERIKKAEKLVSEAEDAFAIGSKGHFKSLEALLDVRKKLVKAIDMYHEIKSYEDKLGTAHYKNTTVRLLDDLEPLANYIIEHSGLDPKH
jgi:hypothetical protein|tara:strand:- start:1038 stop:1388 length:351 start_codon:yes stop_codon:yes gene_type:complete